MTLDQHACAECRRHPPAGAHGHFVEPLLKWELSQHGFVTAQHVVRHGCRTGCCTALVRGGAIGRGLGCGSPDAMGRLSIRMSAVELYGMRPEEDAKSQAAYLFGSEWEWVVVVENEGTMAGWRGQVEVGRL